MQDQPLAQKQSWLDRPLLTSITLNWETLLFAAILLLAFISRFYELGLRVMSHDETSHVYFSWQLYRGQGYSHSPLTHGPLQFHLIALSYFLFGDSDFAGRIPVALFSVATIAFLWAFRRYLGRVGTVVAAALFLISPYMLYYGRYARNESYVGLFGLMTLWAILRYLDRGENRYLYILTAATVLHFTAKETSFIYTAQALLFLGFLFLSRVGNRNWQKSRYRQFFFTALSALAILLVLTVVASQLLPGAAADGISATEVAEPVVPSEAEPLPLLEPLSPIVLSLGGLALLALLSALIFLFRGYGWERLRRERSFSLMVLLGTLVLPHLAAFPITWLGRDPQNYADTNSLIFIVVNVVVLLILSGLVGFFWNRRVWLINLAIFYAIFFPLYTTVFTNPNGFFTGLVGSLGYWLEQQGVQRGNQPWYYYWGVQIPIYEYLAGLGTLLAARMGWKIWRQRPGEPRRQNTEDRNLKPAESRSLALTLFAFWTVTSLIAYTLAGEKMPWLTYHIALPMLLLSGWAFGRLIKNIQWGRFKEHRGALALILMIVFLFGLFGTLSSLLGANPPFQGPQQSQLTESYRFVFRIIVTLASGYALWRLTRAWERRQVWGGLGLVVLAGLALLTARAAYRANFINYDDATEYLVYAHMARGPKEVFERIEELSQRIEDGNTLMVAYDNETSYPFWWYLRNFPNQRYYGETPGRELREAPVIIVGDTNYGKLEPVVGNAYYQFDYIRIWWPNQDYFDFSTSSVGFEYTAETGLPAASMSRFEYLRRALARLWNYLDDGQMRAALYDIWMHRDFTRYFAAKGQNMDLTNWSPSRTMRMYVRKDIVAQIWDFGVEPVEDAAIADPYEGKGLELAADLIFGQLGSQEGQFNAPRGLALAPDGSLYVADSSNHRIQQFSPDGSFVKAWGEFADLNSGDAPGGSFFEPWGVAVSPDGRFVYVADTWNHRIQKFSASGRFITTWGTFGQGDEPFAMWGPRDLLVDEEGNVLVVDTGNKRIKVFNANGTFISQYGIFGFDLGEFDEPVGIALDRQRNRLYVADTWNQRVQVFNYSGGVFEPLDSWDISGWYGQSLQNKPYLSVGADGRVYITDPEGGRVLVYESDGSFVHFWGGYDQSAVFIGIAQGITADDQGNIWLSDSQNNQLLHFTAP